MKNNYKETDLVDIFEYNSLKFSAGRFDDQLTSQMCQLDQNEVSNQNNQQIVKDIMQLS